MENQQIISADELIAKLERQINSPPPFPEPQKPEDVGAALPVASLPNMQTHIFTSASALPARSAAPPKAITIGALSPYIPPAQPASPTQPAMQPDAIAPVSGETPDIYADFIAKYLNCGSPDYLFTPPAEQAPAATPTSPNPHMPGKPVG